MQHLKWFLPNRAIYLPADLHQWTPETELCDLDNDRFPSQSLTLCDAAVMLGVISHLNDPDRMLHRLGEYAPNLIVSYSIRELHQPHKSDKLSRKRKNSFSLNELVSMLRRNGFVVVHGITFRGEPDFNGQVIIRATSRALRPELMAERETARAQYVVPRQKLSAAGAIKRLYFMARTYNALNRRGRLFADKPNSTVRIKPQVQRPSLIHRAF
jgi:hypothetical protein